MAEHADAAELSAAAWRDSEKASVFKRIVAASVVLIALLGGAASWLGYQTYQQRQQSHARALFVEAARQGAISLTNIGYESVDQDIARILNSSTGVFHDDFQKRAKPFAFVVRQARSKSEGAVTAAAIASQEGDRAEVLLAVSLKMSTPAAAQSEPQSWRMRISVVQTGDVAKISDVQFVS